MSMPICHLMNLRGEYLDYTSSRLKEDTSCGYIKGIESSNGYSFNATLVGVDETGYCEDFELIDYDVNGR